MTSRVQEERQPEELRGSASRRAEAVKRALMGEIRARGISQRQLGRQLGYGWTYVANLFGTIRGRDPAHLRIDTFFALADLLGLDPLKFLGEVLAELPAEEIDVPAPERTGQNPSVVELRRIARQAREGPGVPRAEVQQVVDAALDVVRGWTRVLSHDPDSSEPGDEDG